MQTIIFRNNHRTLSEKCLMKTNCLCCLDGRQLFNFCHRYDCSNSGSCRSRSISCCLHRTFCLSKLSNFASFAMSSISSKEGQRHFVFSQWRLGKRGAQILAELTEIHGEEAISKAAVYRWISEFKDGRREVFVDTSARGRPTSPTRKLLVEKIKSILASDRRVTVRELADRLGSPKTSIHRVLTEDLAMVKLSARWVPRLLTDEMKAARVEACRQNFRLVRDFGGWEEFKFALVTGDETWVPHFDPETKEESKVWSEKGSDPPLKAKREQHCKKVMHHSLL